MAAAGSGPALGNIADEVRRCTVQVLSPDETAAGSGVVVAGDLAVTNAHVLQGATQANVRLWSGQVVNGHVERQDLRRDLALLRIPGHGSAAAILRDSASIRPGEFAVAVGSPMGFIGALSMGVIRALGPVPGLGRREWIQADVRLAPGNSGGPLADSLGRVIGINTMVCNGLGLAIPSSAVQQFLAAKAPFRLGVTVRPVTLASGKPALILLELEKGGVAERASLLPGDLVVAIDDTRVRSVEDLSDALGRAGKTVSVSFLRGGQDRVRQTTGVAA